MSTADPPQGFATELRQVLRRGWQAWCLVPRRDKGALGGATLVMACTSLCNTAMPLLLGRLVDGVKQGTEQGQSPQELYRLAAGLLGLLALAYLLREPLHVLRRFLVDSSCNRIGRDMSVKLMAHLLQADLARLSHEKVGTLHGRIFRSVDGLVRFLRLSFLDFFPAVFTGLFALAAAVSKQPLLGLVMVGVIPAALFLTVRQLMSQKGVRLKLMRIGEEIDGTVVEQLGHLEYVRAANTQAQEVQRLARATERRRAKEVRHQFTMSLFGCAKTLNEGFFHILVLGSAIYLAIRGTLSFGDVLTFSILFLSVMTPLSEVHRVLDEGHESSLRVGELLEMLAEPVDASFATTRTREPRLLSGKPALVMEGLQVDYLTTQGKVRRALDGLSLAIRHGEIIGVAGRSGCGKSTLLRVLLRLTHPSGGQVWLGGVPLEEVSRADLARLIGYVGQSPFVFSGTVRENIAYGNEQATPAAIRRVARLAHLHDEILLMPHGYETLLTERGQNLSGGQRQRLALARILLKEAPILILDEATSALDNLSERHVQRALGLARVDRTIILVAHRLSTLRDADRIFVLDAGQVVEVGTYLELVKKGGVFADLVMSAETGVTASPSADESARPEATIAEADCLSA